MDNISGGLVMDMAGAPFNPTEEELEGLDKLREKLTDFLHENHNLSQPVLDALEVYNKNEEFLLIFVRGRKLNVQKAFDSIKRFAEIRYEKYPDLYPLEVPDYVHFVIENRIITALKHRDHLGRVVVALNFDKWDPAVVSLEEIIVVARYIADFAMTIGPAEMVKTGFVIVYNCKGAGLRHAKHYTVSAISKLINLFWLAYPFPVKGVYLINAPAFVKPMFALVRPLFPAKLMERILITSGVTELHRHLSPAILPKSYGGTLSEEEAVLSLEQLNFSNNL